ncbi:MAG: hypothetical protein ACYS9V_13010 [Planctomycetota bacterium]|jgi:hypothetical protein
MKLTTREVGIKLGIRPQRLQAGIWDGRISPPQKDSKGDYIWDEDDVTRAVKVLNLSHLKQGK